ncbi:MAG: hypothetical protein AB7F75_06225 [Planctomycetota bacterium]
MGKAVARRGGFVLIIVVALLGVMAYMALQLAETSHLASKLGDQHLHKIKSRLYARSGLERVISQVTDLGGGISPRQIGDGTLTAGGDQYQVDWRDASGCISLNDGISSGRAQLGSTYDATALMPYKREEVYAGHVYFEPIGGLHLMWLDPNPPPGVVKVGDLVNLRECGMETFVIPLPGPLVGYGDCYAIYDLDPCGEGLGMIGWEGDCTITRVNYRSPEPQHVSGQANLRLRRLLNAYGNAHRYIDFLNGEAPIVPTGNMTGFTFTGAMDCLPLGQDLTPSDGLGDILIAARPAAGFTQWETVAPLVDAWGVAHLNPDYIGTSGFFSKCREDFTLWGAEDTSNFTLRSPFVEPWKHQDASSSAFNGFQTIPMNPLDESPPDFSLDRWINDPTMPINPRAASRLVLAAMFYACADVHFLVESSQTAAGYSYTQGSTECDNDAYANLRDQRSSRPRLGLAGCAFKGSRITENGDEAVAQPNRLMSMRDALVLSKGLKDFMATGSLSRTPMEFKALLTAFRGTGSPYERADPGVSFNDHPDEGYFTQDYVERVLPELLTTDLRLPGFLGGPAAMHHPLYETTYFQLMDADTVEQPTDTSNAFVSPAVLRMVSEFVPRRHLPKLGFNPSGIQIMRSVGRLMDAGGQTSVSTVIQATIRQFQTAHVRTQADFENLTDNTATSSSIRTGPNVTTRSGGFAAPDPHMGMVGLQDLPESYVGWSQQPQIAMNFSGNIQPQAGCNPPQPPTLSQDVSLTHTAASHDIYVNPLTGTLLDSRPEVVEPLLGRGGKAGDLGPCGGLLMHSMGHGPWAEKKFEDALYWRLYGTSPTLHPNTLWDTGSAPGTSLGRGFVQMWFRIPTGPQYPADLRPLSGVLSNFARGRRFKHVLAHLRVWERGPETITGSHALRYGWNPVDIDLYYSFNTVTRRHEIHASFVSLTRPLSSNPATAQSWHRYDNTLFGIPIIPVANNSALPYQDDQLAMPFPFTFSNYTMFLRGGGRSMIKRVILKDIPENGPGTWHLVSMGWNTSRSITGVEWAGGAAPWDDKFWLRLHDSSNADTYSVDFHAAVNSAQINKDYTGFDRDNNLIDGIQTLDDVNMVFSLGESHCYGGAVYDWATKTDAPYRRTSDTNYSGIPWYTPLWRLDSCIDNVRVVLGGVPNVYNGFNAPGYGLPTPERFDLASEPHWDLRLPCPVGSRILRVSSLFYSPRDSGELTVLGPNVPRIDLQYSPAPPPLEVLNTMDGCIQMFSNQVTTTGSRLRFTYKKSNIKNNAIVINGSDNANEIPWISEVTVQYRPPGTQVEVLHFSLGD